MHGSLGQMLAEREWILADGATGTNLFAMGLAAGESPELWNDARPGEIAQLYQCAVDAGSDLFLTNSFGGNAARLKLHGAARRARELSRISAEIGREVAEAAERPVAVAGCVGPTGEIMEPAGTLTRELAVEIFHEQADGLIEGGADLLWVETISSLEELAAAEEAFRLAGAPWCGTMSFDTAGRTMMGVGAADLASAAAGFDTPPLAFGANCGVGAPDLLRTVLGLAAQAPELPLIAKANAGIPEYVEGRIVYSGTPALMADYAALARDSGARIIGGCCGTTPAHLERMREALETRPRGDPPSLERVAEALGPFSSPGDGSGSGSPAPRARRRRRSG